MAEFNLGGNSLEKSSENAKTSIVSNESVDNLKSVPDNAIKESTPISDDSDLAGMSKEELEDPNRINVTIADKKAPLVILFGPPACGKTMTLVRLTRYLRSEGYKISPIKSFRPSYDKNYESICNDYDIMINQTNAAKSTELISFMLVEIILNGKRLCQILEAPGEYYFDPQNPNGQFSNYVNTIINSSNRKIWCIMLEPDWENHADRSNYVTRIHSLKKRMRPKDRTIFVLNKIDLTNFVISPGRINIGQARRDVENLYPGIFAPFRNMNPITRFFSEWRCDFVPFQTGDFTKASNNELTYQEGPQEYPAKLWNIILKRING